MSQLIDDDYVVVIDGHQQYAHNQHTLFVSDSSRTLNQFSSVASKLYKTDTETEHDQGVSGDKMTRLIASFDVASAVKEKLARQRTIYAHIEQDVPIIDISNGINILKTANAHKMSLTITDVGLVVSKPEGFFHRARLNIMLPGTSSSQQIYEWSALISGKKLEQISQLRSSEYSIGIIDQPDPVKNDDSTSKNIKLVLAGDKSPSDLGFEVFVPYLRTSEFSDFITILARLTNSRRQLFATPPPPSQTTQTTTTAPVDGQTSKVRWNNL